MRPISSDNQYNVVLALVMSRHHVDFIAQGNRQKKTRIRQLTDRAYLFHLK